MFTKNRYIINESAFSSGISINKKNVNSIEFIAVLQEANKKNRNGRIYPKEVLEQGINSPFIREKLADNSLMCECGHPADTSVQRQMTIDLRNVAFLIHELWWEGDLLKGRCETANTAVGHDMMGLIEQGVTVCFSLRAQGNVHPDPMTGAQIVEPGIQILCWDWVGVPSHAGAKIESICEETKRSLTKRSAMTLTEAATFYEQGELIDMGAETLMETVDYTKKYNRNLKRLSEMYLPESGDKVVRIDLKETLIQNGNKQKKVMTEDYLVKDIRAKILELTEELGEVAAEPIATEDREAKEADVDLDNADIYNKETEPEVAEEINTEGV